MFTLAESMLFFNLFILLMFGAFHILVTWLEKWWQVAIGLGILVVPLFFLAGFMMMGIVWVYMKCFKSEAEAHTNADGTTSEEK